MRTIDFLPTKFAYSINDLLDGLPIGRTALYADINSGRLRVVKRGRRTFALPPDVADYLENLPAYRANVPAEHQDD